MSNSQNSLRRKILGRQTGVSPEDLSGHCLDEFCGDLPSFIHPQYHSKCKTQMVFLKTALS